MAVQCSAGICNLRGFLMLRRVLFDIAHRENRYFFFRKSLSLNFKMRFNLMFDVTGSPEYIGF